MLTTLIGLINIYSQYNAIVLGRNRIQINYDCFIIAISSTCEVISHMHNGATHMFQVSVIHDILIAFKFPINKQQSKCITVNILRLRCKKSSLLLNLIPTEANNNSRQAGMFL